MGMGIERNTDQFEDSDVMIIDVNASTHSLQRVNNLLSENKCLSNRVTSMYSSYHSYRKYMAYFEKHGS